MAERNRSASPAREPKVKKQKMGGFKWKEKKPREDSDSREPDYLDRGYRNRSPKRDNYREHEHKRERRDANEDGERSADRPSRQRESDSYRPQRTSDRVRDEGPHDRPSSDKRDRPKAADKPSKPPKSKAPPPSNEPMIVVNVNDRLGTKAAIPCLASDSVKAFKAMVAMHIGRQPHEIMLKRQGERPFKDQLTLEDYGVSNGVQLDLELDTGD
ncbi:hypothetical protein BAUCODRAFT_169917 [Baudoinia panamericana UAMH 10762]|uniref:Ubiquitin-like modifier HUB1 n=1 Tax=Baudoinia panamericana (strain UAMH 10762) TaxID=717646 RepID=M2M0D5_BAUPA|nr:uncharacterized protein BAUCODRAFT_169917 [Baudoinia panamericana UAMH 10762]EMD00463.1 hypothetical protein BAUCODRAFT_169917 [Baudoinia panamericana UAMH 10762]